ALAFRAGMQLPGTALAATEPRAVVGRRSQAWPRFATAFASKGPAAFVVEDLHWAEDQLLEMLERLLARSSGSVLFLVTARPEFAEVPPQFTPGGAAPSSAALRPLTGRQGAQLVASLMPMAEFLPSPRG